ncbi:aminotransferase class V-fold PLP-dependent enzyme [Aquincola sp. S2]|uniref:Aminotransferase class V-fold PLP-dependent enzyme n=1 Tax=Pseudaquabacterium terrae TaxID=2732868 RepID=A0ABX2EGE0_9BURK|nr:aminotransferase class V-fold PLP-dependent enzyme [Aquabacterium terrae]NRF67651.1 aminotransferase class V-fold PLP-dependent enzyme [Aquabacterium terrae]
MDLRTQLGLRPVINVSGTMTSLGASIAVPAAVEAAAAILPQFVEIADLQRCASAAIARACGSEAGFITASCAAGITLAVAGTMTGDDLAAIERLPDCSGLKHAVVMQAGHLVNYGAPIDQAVRLAGARVVPVGQATEAHGYQLEGAIGPSTTAVLHVVSHHTVSYAQIPLVTVIEVAHARGVPVIVDAASEYDLRGFISRGADIALYSAHKFLGGPTAGIVAGRKALVRAAYLQNHGIGRGMKVGKEGIYGSIAALQAWGARDHAAVRESERACLYLWRDGLAGQPGVRAVIEPDPTGNPLERLRIHIDARSAHITAWDFVDALAAGEPPVIARDHEAELGYFDLDPCNLHPGQERLVLQALTTALERARSERRPATPLAERRRRQIAQRLRWPD